MLDLQFDIVRQEEKRTKIGALLLVTFVLGLSWRKVSLRWGARLLDQASNSSARAPIVRKDMSCVVEAG